MTTSIKCGFFIISDFSYFYTMVESKNHRSTMQYPDHLWSTGFTHLTMLFCVVVYGPNNVKIKYILHSKEKLFFA